MVSLEIFLPFLCAKGVDVTHEKLIKDLETIPVWAYQWKMIFNPDLTKQATEVIFFEESIVVELKFGRKKLFFTVLYRSPAFHHTSPEFLDFLSNFTNLYSKIKNENPYASFFTGDFNGHSQLWWPDGDTIAEGREIENLLSSLSLSQLISEPTNFEPNKKPSSLDPFCHHQITYCKVNFNIPPPPHKKHLALSQGKQSSP